MSNGTSSYELGQFGKLGSAVMLALPTALDGVDPKVALKSVDRRGEQFGRHIRKFFVPPDPDAKVLRPTLLVTIPQVPVNYDLYDLDWNERINQAGPNTSADNDVRKVGDLYVVERKGVVLTDITLVGFGQYVQSEPVLDFAAEWQFGREMNPYEAFALPTHRPNLHRELGRNVLAAVSLEHREFRAERRVCCSWWDGAERDCSLRWFGDGWDGGYVFGFVRES